MGFALGASFFFGMYGRNVTESGITAHHEQKAANETTKSKKDEADEAIAFYTLWLMAFTGILAIATIGLGGATLLLYLTGEKQFRFAIRSSVRQLAATNKSIKISERALTELEAPVIQLKVVNPGLNLTDNEGRFAFAFENHGRSPAHILEFAEDIVAVAPGIFPPPPDRKVKRGRGMPYGIISPPGGQSEEFGIPIVRSQLTGPRAGPNRTEYRYLYFVGYVTYADIFGGIFTVGFCLLYDPPRARWAFRGDERYNYHRKETEPYTSPPIDQAAGTLPT